MTARIRWLIALLAAAVLAMATQTMALGVATAQECSVCEFSDDEGEVFP